MSHNASCATCTKRRVKCDGARPNCRQCQQANRICFPSLQKETKFSFVIEKPPQTTLPPLNQKKVYQRQKHAAMKESHLIPKSPSLPSNNSRQWIPPSLTISLEDQAIAFYFHQHVISPIGMIETAESYDKYFPMMWRRSRRGSAFCLLILATSYNAFGKAKKNNAASKVSKLMYFQAISIIQKSLQDPVDCCSDETLLATMVLSFYELISWDHHGGGEENLGRPDEVSKHKSRCFCHMDGATAVLKARQQGRSLNKRNLDLDKLVRRRVIRAALHRSTGVPSWLEDGAIFGESGFSLELDKWTINITRIQFETQELSEAVNSCLQNENYLAISQLKDLIEEAISLDNEMFLWTTRLSPEWCYQTYIIDSESSRVTSYNGVVHVYSSLSHAVTWNAYRTTRIILKSVMIKLLHLLETQHENNTDLSIEAAISSIGGLIDDICASIPFFAGEVNYIYATNNGNSTIIFEEYQENMRKEVKASEMAYLSFPLYTIIDTFPVTGTSFLQQQWIRNCLLRVSHATSHTILEKFAG